MAHNVAAFISNTTTLHQFAKAIHHSHSIHLVQGHSLLPLQSTVIDQYFTKPSSNPLKEHSEFTYLFPELAVLVQECAANSPIAYIETDYFGGVGTQAAIAWHGKSVYGPLVSETTFNNGVFENTPSELELRAINRVLQYIGVTRNTAIDEFDALGLGRFRSNEAWIEYNNTSESKK